MKANELGSKQAFLTTVVNSQEVEEEELEEGHHGAGVGGLKRPVFLK